MRDHDVGISARDVQEVVGHAIVVIDAEGIVRRWDARAATMFELSADDAIGRPLSQIPPLRLLHDLDILTRCGAGKECSVLLRVRAHDGRMRAIATWIAPIVIERRLVAVVCAASDETTCRQALDGLAGAEARMEALVDASGDLIAVTDADGTIRSLDGPLEELIGVQDETLIGRNLLTLVADVDLERAGRFWQAQVETSAVLPATDFWMRRPDGSRGCLSVLVRNKLGDQALEGMVVTARDVTEKKYLEQARSTLADALIALVRSDDETELLSELCRLIVAGGSYRAAWVGMADPEQEGEIRVVAAADHAGSHVDGLGPIAGTLGLQGPIATALETRAPYLASDIAKLPLSTPWRSSALRSGVRSMALLPLVLQRDIGLLAIYGEEPKAFGLEAMEVLNDLRRELVYGVDAIRGADERRRYRQQLEASLSGMVQAIATAVELQDPFTAGHQRRVADLSTEIAEAMGCEPDVVTGMGVAASLHDIGKLAVPAEILNRPGPLTVAEYSIVKEHSRFGYEIIARIEFPWPVADTVLHHHERLDGSGYPDGLTAKDLSREVRILSVADTVEAMLSHRPYRPAHTWEETVAVLRAGRGSVFDAEVVDACEMVFESGAFEILD